MHRRAKWGYFKHWTPILPDILNESVPHTYTPLELLRFERELTGEYCQLTRWIIF